MQVVGIVIVEEDALLRKTLEEWLHEEGYPSVGVGDLTLAWEVLRRSAQPLVVLVEHGLLQFPGEALVAEAGALPRHAYILLSTQPGRAPQLYNPHTQRLVPILALPSELDGLADAVAEAAERLSKVPAATRAWGSSCDPS